MYSKQVCHNDYFLGSPVLFFHGDSPDPQMRSMWAGTVHFKLLGKRHLVYPAILAGQRAHSGTDESADRRQGF